MDPNISFAVSKKTLPYSCVFRWDSAIEGCEEKLSSAATIVFSLTVLRSRRYNSARRQNRYQILNRLYID